MTCSRRISLSGAFRRSFAKRRGKRATILFRKQGYEASYETGCTGRQKVSSVTASGNIEYRDHCTGGERSEHVDTTLEPIDVPWQEAASIQPGELVIAYVDRKTRRGHVATVSVSPFQVSGSPRWCHSAAGASLGGSGGRRSPAR